MSSPTEAPFGEPDAPSPTLDLAAGPLRSASPAPTATPQDSPPAPPPPSRNSSPPPPSSLNSPDSSAFAPSPDSPPSRAPPPPSKSTRSPPPPPPLPSNSSRTVPSSPAAPPPSPPPPPSRTTHSSPPPPVLSSPPPPATKSSPSTTSATSPPPTPSSSSSSTISGGSLVGIGVAGVLAFSVLSVLFYCLCRKKKRYYPQDYYNTNGGPPKHYKDPYYGVDMSRQHEWPSSDSLIKMPPHTAPLSPRNGYDPIPPPPMGGGSPGLANTKAWFTYQDLATATGGFSKANELGEGGFGCVYKGTLSSGQLVAVKQLKAGASQGEKEFQAEVEIISRVHHRHLVSLVGYCIADRQRLLVYDYVPNGTLEYHLHKKMDGPVMDWPTRLKIACGAARGLAYLHEDCHPRIIHRDIKSSNILLDDNFEAQVSDFGLAKLTSDTNTHVTTRVMGTFGYLAPEYASSGKLTDRSDVFSFGVVLLELLTGRKPVDPSQPPGDESLVEWARPVLAQVSTEEDLMEVVDPDLEGAFDSREAMRMLEAAAACVRHSANKRPRMGQVVRALEDDSSISDLNKGHKPGQSGVFGSSFMSTDYENGSYSADMRKYMRVALDTQEFGSECSAATSDYGLNASMSSGEHHTSREMVDQASRPHQRRELVDRSLNQQSRREAASMSNGEHHNSREVVDQASRQHQRREMVDGSVSQQPLREAVDRTSSQQQQHREMVDRTSSQQQRPRAMSVRANMLNFNTQDFRLGS